MQEIERELETERMRLAACGVVACADTVCSRDEARTMHPEYRSASLSDVERRVDECIKLREQRDSLMEALEEFLEYYVDCRMATVNKAAETLAAVKGEPT